MIWFDCKQCGKRHGRAESLSGTMIFCECGHGNRVPWTSTAPEPEPVEAQAAPVPPHELEPPQPRRTREQRRINPAYCLNHDETPSEAVCDACRGSFCAACVVRMQSQTLCGPCKNFLVRGRNRPTHLPGLAIVAAILALVGTLVCATLTYLAVGMGMVLENGAIAAVVFCLIALLLPACDLVLGCLALRQIDSRANLGGRALAMTGVTAGLTGIVWSVAVAVFSIAKHWQG